MKSACFNFLIRLLCLSWLAGCASVPVDSGHSNFSEYAESVFRHQNQLLSRMMMLADSEVLESNDDFESAESAMHEACHLLNDYAEREISGETMSWRFKAKVQDSIQACDASVRHMDAVFNQLISQHPEIHP